MNTNSDEGRDAEHRRGLIDALCFMIYLIVYLGYCVKNTTNQVVYKQYRNRFFPHSF